MGRLRTAPRASATAQKAQCRLQPSCTFTVARVRVIEADRPARAGAASSASARRGGQSCSSRAGMRCSCAVIGTTAATPAIAAERVRRPRRIAAGDKHNRPRRARGAPQQLARLGVGLPGDRTGIHDVHIAAVCAGDR